MDTEPGKPATAPTPCQRRGFAGEFPQGTCRDCGHLIMAHIGCESCAVCRLELLIAQAGGR